MLINSRSAVSNDKFGKWQLYRFDASRFEDNVGVFIAINDVAKWSGDALHFVSGGICWWWDAGWMMCESLRWFGNAWKCLEGGREGGREEVRGGEEEGEINDLPPTVWNNPRPSSHWACWVLHSSRARLCPVGRLAEDPAPSGPAVCIDPDWRDRCCCCCCCRCRRCRRCRHLPPLRYWRVAVPCWWCNRINVRWASLHDTEAHMGSFIGWHGSGDTVTHTHTHTLTRTWTPTHTHTGSRGHTRWGGRAGGCGNVENWLPDQSMLSRFNINPMGPNSI